MTWRHISTWYPRWKIWRPLIGMGYEENDPAIKACPEIQEMLDEFPHRF